MAATITTAAPAAADAPKPAGSGASAASTTTKTANPAPVSLLSTAAIDVEDLLADAPPAPEAESNQDDPNREDETNPEAETQPGKDASDEAKPEGEAAENSEHDDGAPEVVEDQDGKRLVSANHLERALKQRATAKTGEREALARAEAAEKQAAELKAQLEASTEPPATVSPLASLTAKLKVDLDNPDHIENLVEYANSWRSWCKRHPMGGSPTSEGEEWTTEQVMDQLEWTEQVLAEIPKHRDFKTGFQTERAKVKAELPKLFQVGTEEQKAFAAEQRRILNAATAKDQDHIIARQVLTKDIPLSKLAELAERYREERDGIAAFARVPKKASTPTGGNPDKPKPRMVQVSTRPVVSVKPGNADGSRKTLAQQLAAGPVDVEALDMA